MHEPKRFDHYRCLRYGRLVRVNGRIFHFMSKGLREDIEKRNLHVPETQTRSWCSLDGSRAATSRLGNKERSISMSFRTSISARS